LIKLLVSDLYGDPVAENALLGMVSVSGATPPDFEYVTIMVQDAPAATVLPLHEPPTVKALFVPLANVGVPMIRGRLPVFVTVVVCDVLRVVTAWFRHSPIVW